MDKAAELEKIKSKTGIDDLASATEKDFRVTKGHPLT